MLNCSGLLNVGEKTRQLIFIHDAEKEKCSDLSIVFFQPFTLSHVGLACKQGTQSAGREVEAWSDVNIKTVVTVQKK